MERVLIGNQWATEAELADLSESEIKDLLSAFLQKSLNEDSHTTSDLALRSITNKKGGLCGLGALYQALENTILTPSALLKHDWKSMRETIANEIGLTDINSIYDEPMLDFYYHGKKEKMIVLLSSL